MQDFTRAERENYWLSSDPSHIDLEAVCGFLARSHWAHNRSRELIERSIFNSAVYGIYQFGKQVAFARVVTDYATFAYLCDVFVDEAHRGKGLSKWMMEFILAEPHFQSLRRFLLATKDAHGLYQKFGFAPLSPEEQFRFMEILKDGV